MGLWSFIDAGNKDFVHDDNGEVVRIKADSFEEAEKWLLDNEEATDWTNQGTRYINWEELN